MATFETKLSIDVGDLIKGVETAAKTVGDLSTAFTKTSDETGAFLGTVSKGFDEAFGTAKSNVENLEKTIAAMIASGNGSGEIFDGLKASLEQANSEVANFEAAIQAVNATELSPFDKLLQDLSIADAGVLRLRKQLKDAIASGDDPKNVKRLEEELRKAEGEAKDLKTTVDNIDRQVKVDVDVDVDKASSKLGGLSSLVGGALGGAAVAGAAALGGKLLEGAEAGDALADSLEVAYAQAGVKDIEGAIKATTDANLTLANSLGQSVDRVDELSQRAAALSGASGQLNTDLTKAAVGIESLSGGAVKGEAFIKALSRGLADPEGAAAIDALAKKYPQLAETLRGTGDAATKLTAINKELGPTFSTLEAQASGPDAVIQNLKNTLTRGFQDAGLAIMDALAPAIATIAEVLTPLIQQIGPIIGGLVKTVAPVLQSLGETVGTALEALAPVISELLGAIGPIVAQLAGTLGNLIARLVTGLAPILGVVAKLLGTVLKAVMPIVDALTDALGPVIDTLVGALGELIGALAPLVSILVQALSPILTIVARIIGVELNVVMKLLGVVISVVAKVINGLVGFIEFLAKGFMTVVKNSKFLTTAFEAIKNAVINLIGYLPDFIKEALGFKDATAAVEETAEATGDLAENMDDAGNSAKKTGKATEDAGKKAKTAFQLAKEAIDEYRQKQADALAQTKELLERQVELGEKTREAADLEIKNAELQNAEEVVRFAQRTLQAVADADGFAIRTKIKGPDKDNAKRLYNDLVIQLGKAQRSLPSLEVPLIVGPKAVNTSVKRALAEANRIAPTLVPIQLPIEIDASEALRTALAGIDYSSLFEPVVDGADDAATQVADKFKEGLLSYQDAIKELPKAVENDLNLFADAFAKNAEAVKATSDATITNVLRIEEELKKPGKSAEEQKKLTEELGVAQARVFDDIAVAAGASTIALISAGASVGEILKQVVGDTVRSLLALYTPTIIGAFASIIPGPLGLIAGGAAVASLQALLATALNGFEGGGPTGDHIGSKQVAGVVHGKEFVVPEWMYKQNHDLLHHIYAGAPLTSFPAITEMLDANRIEVMREVASTLNISPTTVVQGATVDIEPLRVELANVRMQLEAMDALHETAVGVEITTVPGYQARQMKRQAIRDAR